ncbi:hypothetical protein FACS189487_10070 [Campylobacterota bacterium]|nr:hypothetical protein FACS189487_10070 [Campylobacterota bacterium]
MMLYRRRDLFYPIATLLAIGLAFIINYLSPLWLIKLNTLTPAEVQELTYKADNGDIRAIMRLSNNLMLTKQNATIHDEFYQKYGKYLQNQSTQEENQ